MCFPPKPAAENGSEASVYPDKAAAAAESASIGGSPGHPVSLEGFYKKHPSFIWGPILVSALLYGLSSISVFKEYMNANSMQFFGFEAALHYTVYAILASYAFHGWCTTHAPRRLKIQSAKEYEVSPDAMAARSTAALLTELIYAFMPIGPNSTSWMHFFVWTAIVAIYWDAHFYAAHRYVHENKAAYRFFHKTHHLCKEPNCFGAYFVTYQSHVVLEQSVIFILAMAGLPRDVFVFTMYWGTILTYVEHSGYELSCVKLPILPATFGNLCTLLGLSTGFLDGTFVFGVSCLCRFTFSSSHIVCLRL